MIYEMRSYCLRNGTVPEYLKVVEEKGIAIQRRHLGELVGYFFSEIGPLNQIVHLWAFPSLDERERRRAALMADPAWRDFLPSIRDLIVEGENKILKPAPFSPLGGTRPIPQP